MSKKDYKPYYPLLISKMSIPITHFSREVKVSKMRKSLQKCVRRPEKSARLKYGHFGFLKTVLVTARDFFLFQLRCLVFQTRPGEATAHIPLKRSAAGVVKAVWRRVGKKEIIIHTRKNKRHILCSVMLPNQEKCQTCPLCVFGLCVSSWHPAPSLRSPPLHSLLTLFTQLFAFFPHRASPSQPPRL